MSEGFAPIPAEAGDGLEHAECALCGERASAPLYRDVPDRLVRGTRTFDVVRCRGCGLVRTDPRPTRDAIAAYYPAEYPPFADEETTAPSDLRSLGQRLRALPYRLRHGEPFAARPPAPDAGRLLDVGAGAGMSTVRHVVAGWDAWAIEPSPQAVRTLTARTGIPPQRIRTTTAEDAEFPPESFDLVLMFHVIEHLHDPRRVLTNVRRWLRPGGRVVIRCPNFASRERRVFGRRWVPLDVPRHLQHFEPRSLQRLLGAEGLRIAAIRPEFQLGTLPASLIGSAAIPPPSRARRLAWYGLYYGLMPVTSAACAFSQGACVEVVAVADRA